MTEDLRADLLFWKGQSRTSIPRPDCRGGSEIGGHRRIDRAGQLDRITDAVKGIADVIAKIKVEWLVLDADDALVVKPDEPVERDAVGPNDLFGKPHEHGSR